MLFGPFKTWLDELAHVVFSMLIAMTGGLLLRLLSAPEALAVFCAGIALDIDHLANPILARLLKLPAYQKTNRFGSNGYTIKILHGFDMAAVFGIVSFSLTSCAWLAFFVFIALSAHELWDFLVYPHGWKELFLISRARSRFKPGVRKSLTGLVFKLPTLTY